MAGEEFIHRRVQVALLLLLSAAPGTSAAEPVLLDHRAAADIDYSHVGSPTESKYLVETMGGGVALLDFDADGLLDIFFVNGGRIREGSSGTSVSRDEPSLHNRLYRNLGDGRFADTTAGSGLETAPHGAYGMGAAVGDFDNDGFADLLVTGVGAAELYRNLGDGSFESVGLNVSGWSASAGFADVDGNGLLNSGLGRAGFAKAMNVMALEEIVRVIEDDHTGYRDAENFHFTVFGEPSLSGDWAWRVEGHHLSLHYLIKNGELVSTSPTFFGANPHEAPQGPHKGLRALAREEDLARDLIRSLQKPLQKKAIFAEEAPYDMLTMADKRAKMEGDPAGIAASEMNADQYDKLLGLIAEYAHNMPPEIATRRLKTARETPREQLFFGWAGAIDRPEPKPMKIGSVTTENRHNAGNYYRIQWPTFLIEYANTQNQSNHSHSVWREFEGDFGYDVMAAHYGGSSHTLGVAVAAD